MGGDNHSPMEYVRSIGGKTMMVKLGFTFFILTCLIGRSQAVEAIVTTIEGATSTQELMAISPSGEVQLGKNQATTLDSLSRIDFSGETVASKNPSTLFLQCNSILRPGNDVTLGAETIQTLMFGADLKLPIDAVKALRLQPSDATKTLFEKGLESAADGVADRDRVFLRKDTELQEVSGLIESIDATHLMLDRDGSALKLPRENVYGIIFAVGPAPDLQSLNSRVTLVDGSLVAAQIDSYADGHISLSLIGGATVRFPEKFVQSINIQSDRVRFLSDLEPSIFLHEPIVLNRRMWTADANINGGPMRLGETRHTKGIGMVSGMELVFEVPGYTYFAATPGIDFNRRDKGDCEAVVLVDGKEIHRQRLRGGVDVKPLNIKIDGVTKLTLKVEPGENFDLSDHVNWAGARLLK